MSDDVPVAEVPALADPKDYRRALGRFPTGVAVVTALGADGRAVGMTINSFTSVSLEPPVVAWSIGRKAPSYEVFADARHFVINVLSLEQLSVSAQFSRPSQDKFAGIAWREGVGGVPVLDGCVAQFECSVRERIAVGDHDMLFGDVLRYAHAERLPLAYALSGYASVNTLV